MLLQIENLTFSDKILNTAKNFLTDLGFSPSRADMWDRIIILVVILVLAFLVYLLFNKVIIKIAGYIVNHTSTKWDLILYKKKFFHRVFLLIPPLIIIIFLPIAFSSKYASFLNIMDKAITIYLTVVTARIIISLIETCFDYYLTKGDKSYQQYKSIIDMSRIFIYAFLCLAIIGIILNMDIKGVITGLGAFAAVIVLIFKDTLLGFIAGIQLTHNKMISVGDWITVPNTGANGNIIEISILTIKVQNFDNTFVYVPAYSLVTSSFQNWIGMAQSGIRRIKKPILLDINTIKEIDSSDISKIVNDNTLCSYLSNEGKTTFQSLVNDFQPAASTNMGMYRLWITLFLENHKNVTTDPYMIINDMPSNGAGLPLEIIFFITTTNWNLYEQIQSTIYEQMMGMAPKFGLKIFQFDDCIALKQ
ncbi:MAG: mechanosensitive ion channel [Bacteroidales bacterium]|nr:mechanosensitive ion channel [Bacteroidales bacterium]